MDTCETPVSVTEPSIQVWNVHLQSDRSLILRHTLCDDKPLASNNTIRLLQYIYEIWKFPVILESVDSKERVTKQYQFPEKNILN